MTSLRHGFRFIFAVMSQTDTDMSQKTRLVSIFLSEFASGIDFDISAELQMLSELNNDELMQIQNDAVTQLQNEKNKKLLHAILKIAVQIGRLDGAFRDEEYVPITRAAEKWGIDSKSLLKE